MERTHFVKLSVNPILTVEDLGLDRRAGLDEASRGLAQVSEAQIVRWVQFPAGALFFTLVPEDPESGGVYVFERRSGVFYWLNEQWSRQCDGAPWCATRRSRGNSEHSPQRGIAISPRSDFRVHPGSKPLRPAG